MRITDEQRSIIASLVVHAGDSIDDEYGIDVLCLCCSGMQSLELAAEIVGGANAPGLVQFAIDRLGCGWRDRGGDAAVEDSIEQTYLDRIADLETMEDLGPPP